MQYLVFVDRDGRGLTREMMLYYCTRPFDKAVTGICGLYERAC